MEMSMLEASLKQSFMHSLRSIDSSNKLVEQKPFLIWFLYRFARRPFRCFVIQGFLKIL